MTKSEAIEELHKIRPRGGIIPQKRAEAIDMAIKALEEIQQYRAIGTVEEITNLIKFLSFDDDTSILEDLRMLVEYYAIGTVEEFKAYKQGNCTNNCKHYDSTIEYVRNKAIDEFAEKLSLEVSESIIWDMLATMSKNSSLSDTSDEIVDYVINTANEIAEQLKTGGEGDA